MVSKEELDRAFDARFPLEIKEKLQKSRVAVAGLGGLGSNIAVMLARSGIGHLFLVDFDTVDTTNLNRQVYGISHLGMEKSKALLQIIKDINPYLDVEAKQVKVDENNIASLFSSYDVVCEAFDKPDQKAMLVGNVLEKCKNSIVVSGNGMAGYGDANLIQTSKRFERLYVCGDGSSDVADGLGLMAPRVAICAGHQANKVIQIILQKEDL